MEVRLQLIVLILLIALILLAARAEASRTAARLAGDVELHGPRAVPTRCSLIQELAACT